MGLLPLRLPFFGLGFGGEMSAYPVVNRQYFGTGPVASGVRPSRFPAR